MVVATVLSAHAFAVAARKAHSQQFPGAEALPQPVEEATGPVAEKPAGIFPSRVEGGSSVSRSEDEEPEFTSAGSDSPMESPLRDMPQPVSPLAPSSEASLLLSGGGVPGPGGLALLLRILVFCLMLTRRGSELLLALNDSPKPSSAPRLPLERPG